ncbi:hypothetical protein EUTSA_v10010652mg [Eutrema salsugineum]|uniref:Uncharacterized protein n=1 Tax=Eutrema salsugineum TaxID=72664 RepID=V4LS68_EUTSA|nr:uncharacterized protein LOC18020815 [Eutrema salsugineum]ESQ45337.1 hypothetical protein EUTSA_v10010652mg [Eutrema salsugineum]
MISFLTIEEMMDMNRSRRLNFNAPFLSTKRHVTQEKLPGQFPEASVPFCWETAPGMPKNSSLLKNDSESETPRLKLPPGRLKMNVNGENSDFDDVSESLTPARLLRMKKRDTQEHSHYTDRDAVDVLSLTQAIDMVEHPKDSVTEFDDGSSGGGDSNGYLTMESTERSQDMSPSYIIERFLPDAAALAAVTSAASQRRKKKLSYLSATVRQSCFSPKACGLHVLLPWSTKHRICGVKNAFSPSSHIHLQPKFITKDN